MDISGVGVIDNIDICHNHKGFPRYMKAIEIQCRNMRMSPREIGSGRESPLYWLRP
jgi:hypothetical protein